MRTFKKSSTELQDKRAFLGQNPYTDDSTYPRQKRMMEFFFTKGNEPTYFLQTSSKSLVRYFASNNNI